MSLFEWHTHENYIASSIRCRTTVRWSCYHKIWMTYQRRELYGTKQSPHAQIMKWLFQCKITEVIICIKQLQNSLIVIKTTICNYTTRTRPKKNKKKKRKKASNFISGAEQEGSGILPYKASPLSSWSNSESGIKIDWSLTLPPRLFCQIIILMKGHFTITKPTKVFQNKNRLFSFKHLVFH